MPPKHGAHHGAEFTAYRLDEIAAVESVLIRHRGALRAVKEVELVAETGLSERKARAILADLDCVRWVIGKCKAGIFWAENEEEAAPMTAELAAKRDTLGDRVGRRNGYRWGPRQLSLGIERIAS